MTTMIATPSPQPAKKVKPKPLREVLDRILQQLQRRDQYLFFAQPVSASDVPDYYDHIKRPMDLGTMQTKLEQGKYHTLDAFKADFLLVTGNAQYYNLIDGPSAIVHTEAKKLEEWGLKALAKETPAVEEAIALAAAEAAAKEEEAEKQRQQERLAKQQPASAIPRPNGARLSLKIRRKSSLGSAGPATPRLTTPSRLQHEIKVEDDDEDDDEKSQTSTRLNESDEAYSDTEDAEEGERDEDDEEEVDEEDEEDDDDEDESDDEDDDDDLSTSHRAGSNPLDEADSARSRNVSGVGKKKRRSGGRRRKTGMFGKKQHRKSAVVSILSVAANGTDKSTEPTSSSTVPSNAQRPLMAPVSSTSGAVAALLPLTYRHDGAIDVDALLEDERRTLLRSAGMDAWPDVLAPFVHSLVPLHPDLLPTAQTMERDVKQIIDSFGLAIAHVALPPSITYSYDLLGKTLEQQRLPFATSSGWAFDVEKRPTLPLAWPNLGPSAPVNAERDGKTDSPQPYVRPPRKDKERERDEEGLATLDDWTWPRAHLSRLQDPLDVGLYSGLLPAAWVQHINTAKNGPSRSRLPPYHLASGSAFDSALLDELASLPHRALLGSKPGVISMSASQPSASSTDVTVALEQAAQRDWMPKANDIKKLGARGSDVIREAVYGGPLGEAYASSLEDFVRGAGLSARDNYDSGDEEEEEEGAKTDGLKGGNETTKVASADALARSTESILFPPQSGNVQAPSSYFDENGEMFDQEAYIGTDLIPLDVRKEAGVALEVKAVSAGQSPSVGIDTPRGTKRSRSLSTFTPPPKRQRGGSGVELPAESAVSGPSEIPQSVPRAGEDEDAVDRKRGPTILSTSLWEHVRDTLLNPLTHGQLSVLHEIGKQIQAEKDERGSKLSMRIAHSDKIVVKREIESGMPDAGEVIVSAEDDRARKIRHAVGAALRGDNHKGKLQMYELIRAQGNAVDVDSIARNEADLIAALTLEAAPPDEKLPHPNSDPEQILERYAKVLQEISSDKEQDGRSTPVNEVNKERLERLRISYIALAKRASKLHVVPGKWNAWLQAAQKKREQARE